MGKPFFELPVSTTRGWFHFQRPLVSTGQTPSCSTNAWDGRTLQNLPGMFEFEVEHEHLGRNDIPADIGAYFQDTSADIRAIALIPWEEHCVECAGPKCFSTCDLYIPRRDASCRRFVSGISPAPGVGESPRVIL